MKKKIFSGILIVMCLFMLYGLKSSSTVNNSQADMGWYLTRNMGGGAQAFATGAGGAAGGYAGAWAGAKVGGLIGSSAGPVGTVVGGILGAGAGAL